MQVPPHIRQLSELQLKDYICHRAGVEPTPMEMYLVNLLDDLCPQEERIEELEDEVGKLEDELSDVKQELSNLHIDYQQLKLENKLLTSVGEDTQSN